MYVSRDSTEMINAPTFVGKQDGFGGCEMNRAEFEAAILDRDQFSRISRELRSRVDGARIHPSAPMTGVRKVSALSATAKNSWSDVATRYPLKSYSSNDLHRIGGVGVHKDPLEGLQLAVDRYRKLPSQAAATRLEMAINRLGISNSASEQVRKLMVDAIAVLSEKVEDKGETNFKGDNIAVTLFADANGHGNQIFGNLTFGGILTGWIDLGTVGFNDKISSLTLQVSPDEIGGRVFLFQNKGCLGQYAQFDAATATQNVVGFVGSALNDRASSVLIYRQFANEVIQSVAEIVPSDAITTLIDSTSGIESRRQPIFTWDPFPSGSDGHPNEPGNMFIYIRIPITVDVPHWFDYDAEIRFWVAPFVDENGLLQAGISYFGAWVEGGILASEILQRLMGDQGIPTVLGQVNVLLASATSVANLGGTFSSTYLLPGRNEAIGKTDDDVSIVLLPGPPPVSGPIQ
jgi:hypothetical protein